MNKLFLIACVALTACGQQPFSGSVEEHDQIAENRRIVERCIETNWEGCNGGFVVRPATENRERSVEQILYYRGTQPVGRFHHDEIVTSYLENRIDSDEYLHNISIVLPDDAAWSGVALEFAEQRTRNTIW